MKSLVILAPERQHNGRGTLEPHAGYGSMEITLVDQDPIHYYQPAFCCSLLACIPGRRGQTEE